MPYCDQRGYNKDGDLIDRGRAASRERFNRRVRRCLAAHVGVRHA